MLNIGAGELIFIVVVALLILGPQRLPEFARGVGKFLREFRRQTDEVRTVVEREFYEMDQQVLGERRPAPPPPIPAARPSLAPEPPAEAAGASSPVEPAPAEGVPGAPAPQLAADSSDLSSSSSAGEAAPAEASPSPGPVVEAVPRGPSQHGG